MIKKLVYWQSLEGAGWEWTWHFALVWAWNKDLSKLIGTPFDLCLDTLSIDKFLLDKKEKKLKYWSTTRLSFVSKKGIHCQCVLLMTLWYVLSICARSKMAIKKAMIVIKKLSMVKEWILDVNLNQIDKLLSWVRKRRN